MQYKIDPSKLKLSKEEREKLRKRARTFDFLDDGTNEPWPKGKILHKILSLRNGKRKGNSFFLFFFLSFFLTIQDPNCLFRLTKLIM